MSHTIAVLIDDAEHAQQHLSAVFPGDNGTRWLLVACAPRQTHRIGKWASHSSREHWRRHWTDRLFEQVRGWTAALPADRLHTMMARDALPKVIEQLQREHGQQLEVIDARRSKSAGAARMVVNPGTLLSMLMSFGLGWALTVTD
jgi:hypothetical protein